MAREHIARRRLTNVELLAVPEGEILDRVAAYQGTIDVFLFYAVLEHMTLEERLAALRLARLTVRPEGHIVVCETPNRLTPLDHHTGQIPFLHMLPGALAAQYYGRSGREDFVEAVDRAAADGPAALRDALVRWGYGMSYHEFELAFDDLPAHTVASSYHPLLYPSRPVRGEELHLAATLTHGGPICRHAGRAAGWTRFSAHGRRRIPRSTCARGR